MPRSACTCSGLAAIWVCSVAGVAGAAPFLRIPRQLLASLYLAMGWLAVIVLVTLWAAGKAVETREYVLEQ